MPVYFKAYEQDQWKGDVYFTAADMDDIKDLQKKINNLEMDVSACVTKESLQADINTVLLNGEWKTQCLNELNEAMNSLERNYFEFNDMLNLKFNTLFQVDLMEEQLRSFFLTQGEAMIDKIYMVGKKIKEEINESNTNLLNALIAELEKITWDDPDNA